MTITLPWDAERPADPLSASLCLDDGSLTCSIWMFGEITELHMTGDAWTDLPVPLQALKRAITDRFSSPDHDEAGEDDLWGFQ